MDTANIIQMGLILIFMLVLTAGVLLLLRDVEKRQISRKTRLKEADEEWDRFDRHMKPIREAQKHSDNT